MATDTASGPPPTLTDRERWAGDVTAQRRFTYRWGTYTFVGEFQLFADGEAHATISAPSDPPPAAEAIVAGGLAGDELARNVAAVLAEGWQIDTDGLDAAPAATTEPLDADSEVSA
jgi:hypothetical protein